MAATWPLRDVPVNNARSLWRSHPDLLRGKPLILGNELEEVWAMSDLWTVAR